MPARSPSPVVWRVCNESCLLAWLAGVGRPVASWSGLRALTRQAQSVHVAGLCSAGLSRLLPGTLLRVLAAPSQSHPPVACVCCHLALLAGIGNAVVITFCYGLHVSGHCKLPPRICFHVSAAPSQLPGTWFACVGTIIRLAPSHCCRALAAQLQLPPCSVSVCWHYSHSRLFVLLICVGSAIPVAFARGLRVLSL